MAAAQSANPIYHDPTPAQTRTRRSSSRRSFASPMSRSSSNVESPRTPGAKDHDAFNFNPAHLQAWYLPEHVWNSLPPALKSSVTAVQHSAAAVLTGKYTILVPHALIFLLLYLRDLHTRHSVASEANLIQDSPASTTTARTRTRNSMSFLTSNSCRSQGSGPSATPVASSPRTLLLLRLHPLLLSRAAPLQSLRLSHHRSLGLPSRQCRWEILPKPLKNRTAPVTAPSPLRLSPLTPTT